MDKGSKNEPSLQLRDAELSTAVCARCQFQFDRLTPVEAKIIILTEALRDAARWLESAANFCRLPSVCEAAARARAALKAVQS